jgi:hypothetical protein
MSFVQRPRVRPGRSGFQDHRANAALQRFVQQVLQYSRRDPGAPAVGNWEGAGCVRGA